MLGTLIPFDAPQVIATNAPLTFNVNASANFYTQYPVTSFTISLAFAGLAGTTSDVAIEVDYSLDGTNWAQATTRPGIQGTSAIGQVTCPAAMQFRASAMSINSANPNPTVSASVLVPRSAA
jgi:hypothetical protein